MTQPRNLATHLLLALLLLFFLACADKPTEPELTEEEIRLIIAKELEKFDIEGRAINAVYGLPEQIAKLTVKSTVYLSINTSNGTSSGSGFFIDSDKIATNYHVIEGAIKGTVASPFAATQYPIVEILVVDRDHDLAIVRVEGYTAPPLALGDSDAIWIGYRVFMIGSPPWLQRDIFRGYCECRSPQQRFF